MRIASAFSLGVKALSYASNSGIVIELIGFINYVCICDSSAIARISFYPEDNWLPVLKARNDQSKFLVWAGFTKKLGKSPVFQDGFS